ncbi:MAG: ParB/RepB/Spo0J family partition protein [Candidatus Aureabacteria bacterium]|nr:ParB/RepB/Spo0J family partition protein [Candidatus Auribacterota bacterium]
MVKRALGRGLEALIPETITMREREVVELELGRIRPGRYQPRTEFDQGKLQEIIDSIKEKGVVQPVIVRQVDGEFELIAGERRLRAAKSLGLERIPAIVKSVSDEQALEIAIIENVQREDLNPIEEARAYQKLTEEFEQTQEEIAKKVGRNRATVANTLRLLRLPAEIQEDIMLGRVTAGHAKVILMLETAALQKRLRDQIVAQGLSVRETERCIERMKAPPAHKRKIGVSKSADLLKIEESLRNCLGTQVRITPGRRKGRIEIEYYSQEDLERILEAILEELPG